MLLKKVMDRAVIVEANSGVTTGQFESVSDVAALSKMEINSACNGRPLNDALRFSPSRTAGSTSSITTCSNGTPPDPISEYLAFVGRDVWSVDT